MTQVPAPVYGVQGMVVAGHPFATVEGLRVLEAGGSAVDAAIASAGVLCVVLPQACTLGGDAFMMIQPGDGGPPLGLNASGPSAAAAGAERYANGIPARGPLSICVPGVVRGWETAHQRFGRLPWAELLAPALALARTGFPVSRGLARATEQYRELLAQDPGSRRIFLADDGAPLRAGAILRQPALAASLEQLARNGSEAIYAGTPAESLERLCNERGGALARADLRDYRPEWVTPLAAEYRGVTVCTLPPNSYGLYLLLQLLALESVDLSPRRSPAERIALLVRAARLAFAEGESLVADPGRAPSPEILTPARRRRFREAMRREPPPPTPADGGGTAVVSAVDAEGKAVTLVQSIFLLFGSGVCDPDSGILFNNRMLGFTLKPGHANRLGPRKRPAHTLCPTMMFARGGLRCLLGTPGGPSQTVTLAQVLSNLIDAGMPLASAVGAPRWSMDLEGRCLLEPAFGREVFEALAAQGIEAVGAEAGSPFFGSAEAIEMMDEGVLQGVADWRREACALGKCV